MDLNRIEIGSKLQIKDTSNTDPKYGVVGDIGFVVGDTCYHEGNRPLAIDGNIWLHIPKITAYEKICCTGCTFKVLRYEARKDVK